MAGGLKHGMRMVRLHALSEAKFRLYSGLRAAGFRKDRLRAPAEMLSKPGRPPADISHRSKLDQMEAAFAAIGKRLSIEIRDAV